MSTIPGRGRPATEVNARWQPDMAPYFAELDGLPPDQGFKRVDEIFNVD
jgi:L-rhamnose mutarotase